MILGTMIVEMFFELEYLLGEHDLQRTQIDSPGIFNLIPHQAVEFCRPRSIICIEEPELDIGIRHTWFPERIHIGFCGREVSWLDGVFDGEVVARSLFRCLRKLGREGMDDVFGGILAVD